MSIKRVYAIFIRQWFLIRGNPTRLISIFLWALLDIVLWGFVSKYLGTFGKATFSFTTVILGALLLWEFTSQIQQGIMRSFLEDIWSNNFINFFASPLRIKEYLGGLVTTGTVASLSGFFIIALLAGFAFGYNIFKIGIYILPFLLVLFIFGMAIGIFITAVILRLGPSAEWLGWPIPTVLSVFSGVFYPISTLPLSLRIVSKIIPASYVFESLRSILAKNIFSFELGANLVIGFTLALIYLFLAYGFFIRIYRYSLKSGSLARFNSEEL